MGELDALLDEAARLALLLPPDSRDWAMEIRCRVKELKNFRGTELRPHPKNPRRHPQSQVTYLRGVLEEMGIAGVLLVYQAGDGVWTIIDGECRGANFGELLWPCVVLDVNDAEAEYILATHDQLGALAETDREKLEALLAEVQTEHEGVTELLSGIAAKAGLVEGGTGEEFPEFDESVEKEVKHVECPKCGHTFPA